MWFEQVMFFVYGVACLAGALGVVILRNPFYSVLALVFFFFWVRATLPRLRYDQLMSLGWKVFLPLATVNALVTAILVVVT